MVIRKLWVRRLPDCVYLSLPTVDDSKKRFFISESPAGTVWREHFEKHGSYTWNVTVARQKIVATILPEDLEEFVRWDTSFVWTQFPPATDVLTVHGLADKTVPPYVFHFSISTCLHTCKSSVLITFIYYCNRYDAMIYARALSHRTPGTHMLHMMEDGDHNFTGRQDDVVEAILQWWDTRQRGELQNGILLAGGVKGKL